MPYRHPQQHLLSRNSLPMILTMLLNTTNPARSKEFESSASPFLAAIMGNRLVVVAKDGSGDYTTIKAAMTAIGTTFPASSSTNRYCIVVISSTADGTTAYSETNPITCKDYTSIVSLCGHATILCTVDDDGFILGNTSRYYGLYVTKATPSAGGKAAFKIPNAVNDVWIEDCGVKNLDAGVYTIAGAGVNGNDVRNFYISEGTSTYVFRCESASILHVDGVCVEGAPTITYINYCDGAGSSLSVRNAFVAVAVTNGIYCSNSGTVRDVGGGYYASTNGANVLTSGKIALQGTGFNTCTNALRAAAGTLEGSVVIETSGTYDIITTNASAVIKMTGTFDFSKLSITAGTAFKVNPWTMYSVTPASITNGTSFVLGAYSIGLNAVAVVNPTTQNMTQMENRRILVNVTTKNVNGTLRFSGTSFSEVTGALTPGDTEDVAITATGWQCTSKKWSGTVVLSAVGGLDVILSAWRIIRYLNNDIAYRIDDYGFAWTPSGGANKLELKIEKWDPTNGFTTLDDYTATNTSNGIDHWYRRTEMTTLVFDSSKSTQLKEFIIITILQVSNIQKFRMRLNMSQEQ